MSSSRKKVLVGGTIASLALSLALPISSHFGPNATQQVEAAAGPKFKKPWYVKPDGLSFKKTKSFPVPDDLQYNNRGVRSEYETIPDGYTPPPQSAHTSAPSSISQPLVTVPAPQPSSPSPIMQELQKLYEENGSQAPLPQTTPVPPAAPEVAERSERRARKNGEMEQESRGLLNRLFNNLNNDDKSPATVQKSAQADKAVVEKSTPNTPPAKPNQNAGLPIDLPFPDSPAVADIIVPPQPQPNLLPGVDLTNPEAYQPQVVPSSTGVAMHDPFPLPPLPDGFSNANKVASQSSPASATGGFVLPPLPGIGFTAEQQNVAVEERATIETPQMPVPTEAVVITEKSVIESEPKPIRAGETNTDWDSAAVPQLVDNQSSAKPAKSKSQLPMAPSAQVDESWLNRLAKPAEQHAEVKSAELPPAMQGWRSRSETSAQIDNAVPNPHVFTPSVPTGESVIDAQPAPLPPLVDEPTSEPLPEAEVEPKLTIESESSVANVNTNPKHLEPKPLPMPEQARPAEIPEQTAETEPGNKADKYRRIAERGDRTGFKGFCPVTLKDSLDLVDASPEFRSEFEGQIYYFSSQLAKEKFDFDPFRYSPAQGGIDLVKYLEQGKQEPGRLDYAVWYQDRLFLFSNQQTLEKFRADPAEFVKGE